MASAHRPLAAPPRAMTYVPGVCSSSPSTTTSSFSGRPCLARHSAAAGHFSCSTWCRHTALDLLSCAGECARVSVRVRMRVRVRACVFECTLGVRAPHNTTTQTDVHLSSPHGYCSGHLAITFAIAIDTATATTVSIAIAFAVAALGCVHT